MRRLLPLALVFCLATLAAAAVGASPRPAATGAECVFLPIVRASAPQQTNTEAAAPTDTTSCLGPTQAPPPDDQPTTTPTVTAPVAILDGQVRLRPEHAVLESSGRPVRWTVVLDVSGSMSANFAGQCDRGGDSFPAGQSYWQCTNGPAGAPSVQVAGVGPTYYWSKQDERRIYVAKQAIETLVRQLNMPGNAGFDITRPPDQLGLVWYTQEVARANVFYYSSEPTSVIDAIRRAGARDGDPYRTAGGTNPAAGLYRAATLLDATPPSVIYSDGREYQYDSRVLLLIDGVANQFLDRNFANLFGGSSTTATYPVGHPCRIDNVTEIAACQTTEVGGLTTGVGGVAAGMDRPLTQTGKVSREDLQPRGVSVFVIALSNIPDLVLKDAVASSFSQFFAAPTLQRDASGLTNVDQIITQLPPRTVESSCTSAVAPDWTSIVGPEQRPEGTGLAFPIIGEILLEELASGTLHRAPIRADEAAGTLNYSLTAPPPGDYRLSAYVFFRGADGQTRRYSLLDTGSALVDAIPVQVTGSTQSLDTLSLRLVGDVCGG